MTVLRASLLGGVDGVITSFAVVAGASAASLTTRSLFVVGVSSVIADGFSMGISEFLSSTSERRATRDEEARASIRPAAFGAACFSSFVACGAVPILSFVLARGSILSCAMFSLVELMLLGAARTLVTGEELLVGLVQTASLGAAAGAVAYGVAATVHAA